jgi:hypothetical protein
MRAEGQVSRVGKTGTPPSSRTACVSLRYGRVRLAQSGRPDTSMPPRKVRRAVLTSVNSAVCWGAEWAMSPPTQMGKTELPQEVHGGLVRRGPGGVHEILGGAVDGLMINALRHGQLQEPV